MPGLYDMHTHSRHSHDSTEPLEAMCIAARAAGLGGIAFTDHLDLGPHPTHDWPAMLSGSIREATEMAARHAPHLRVLRGVEVGEPLCNPQAAERILRDYALDVVVMGIHSADRQNDLCRLDHTTLDTDVMLERYFAELRTMAEWEGYDVLAHIGYPLRYIRRDRGVDWDLAPYTAQIDAVMAVVAGTDRALEVNTAGLNRGIGGPSADLEQLRRFKALGGRYVTLGSDAHAARFVGGGFDKGLRIIREAGFDAVTHYEGRRPCLTRI
jgi:histidinol-phosphatase (PHP family)